MADKVRAVLYLGVGLLHIVLWNRLPNKILGAAIIIGSFLLVYVKTKRVLRARETGG
jgi:hypothetical protein